MSERKTKQIHLRVSEEEKNQIYETSKNKGYKNISEYIMDASLGNIKINLNNEKIIHTITLSPTLDYDISLNKLEKGKNIIYETDKTFRLGGRGVNSSVILNELNIKNKAVHYSGGFSGNKIWDLFNEEGIDQYKIDSKLDTRINININLDGEEYLTIEQKPLPISDYGKEHILKYITNNVKFDERVILSGSYRKEDRNFLYKIIDLLNEKNAKIYLNLPGDDLEKIIKISKPRNIIIDLTNLPKLKTKKEIIEYCKSLIKLGAKSVSYIVDLNISIYINSESVFTLITKNEKQKTLTGLRDAFIAGYMYSDILENRLKWAASCMKIRGTTNSNVQYSDILKATKEVELNQVNY